jgi:hypothetical protein
MHLGAWSKVVVLISANIIPFSLIMEKQSAHSSNISQSNGILLDSVKIMFNLLSKLLQTKPRN